MASFTRAAAHEVGGRNTNVENIGTLHAHGYRALGRSLKIAENCLPSWNEDYPIYALTGGKQSDVDETNEGGKVETLGDELFNYMQMQRALMIPREHWRMQGRAFADKWDRWKAKHSIIDYTDMIEIPYRDIDAPPGNPSVGFFDEAQDETPLSMALIRKWGKALDYILMAGDDDQCQPAGTMIDTIKGKVSIENLHAGNIAFAYARRDSAVYKTGRIKAISSRIYTGNMYSVTANKKTTQATSNHKWFAKWNKSKAINQYCVYVMSKVINARECFRVGWCQIMRVDGVFHLGARARLEGAEKAWILLTTDDKAEASIMETYIAAKYGIPTIMFKASMENGLYTSSVIARFWDKWNSTGNAIDMCVFEEYGRVYIYPFWEKDGISRGGASIYIHRTCNLLPDLMLLPLPDYEKLNRRIQWSAFTMKSRTVRNETVYSLDVEKYHSYIADGIITHNCIYEWAGARPGVMLEGEPAKKVVLQQSFRVPRAVHALAQKVILTVKKREPKIYQPRDCDGEVRLLHGVNFNTPEMIIRDMEQYKGKRIMILASCSYMLQSIIKALRVEGIPFHNPYRTKNGAWNPLRSGTVDRLLAFADQVPHKYGMDDTDFEPVLDVEEFLKWYEILKAQGNIPSKMKAVNIAKLQETAFIGLSEVSELFDSRSGMHDYFGFADMLNPAIEWFGQNVTEAKSKALKYPSSIVLKHGIEPLREKPKVVIGTIHCSPADEPILTTDGWIPMKELNPLKHRLAGHHRRTNRMTWGSKKKGNEGFAFEKSVQYFKGNLVVFKTESTKTRVTLNHKMVVKFNDKFFDSKWIVYLMRKGDWWRVGICISGHRPYRSGGLGGRLATEAADCGWVLGVCSSREEALKKEAIIQSTYGLTGLTFTANCNGRTFSTNGLEEIHEALKPVSGIHAKTLLNNLGLDIEIPLWTRSLNSGVGHYGKREEGETAKKNMRGWFTTIAANLVSLNGFIDIPVVSKDFIDGSRERFAPIPIQAIITTEPFVGSVFGLDVPPYNYYVSGGIVVHNSVKGGEGDVVYVAPDLSYAGYIEASQSIAGHDAMARLKYVAYTRARESLILLDSASNSTW